jgi:glycosyltransferase 2 family protein
MKRSLFWVGIVVSVVFTGLALRGLKLDEFWADLSRANLFWILPGIGLYFIAVCFRAWRWSYMLRPLGRKTDPRALYPVVVIGYMGNNIYPARIGEVLRSWVLQRNTGVPVASSLATVVIERVIDGLVMAAFVLIGLSSVPSLSPDMVRGVYVVITLFAAVIGVFFWLALAPATAERLANAVIGKIVPERGRRPLLTLVTRFLDGAKSLRSPKDLGLILLGSVATWLVETGKYWCIAQAFDIQLPFAGLMLVNGVSNLFTIIPGAPGAVGTFEAGGILAATALGVPAALASAYIIVLHVALWLPVTLLGAYFMLRQGLRWADLQKAETARA